MARVLSQETAIIRACECAHSASRRRQGGLKRSEAWCCHWIPRAQSSRLLGRQQLPRAHYHLAVWRRASAALWIEYYCSEHAHTYPSEKLLSQLWEPTTNALPSSLFSFLLSTLLSVAPFSQSLANRHSYFLLALHITFQLGKKCWAGYWRQQSCRSAVRLTSLQ